jgi:plastocyanin
MYAPRLPVRRLAVRGSLGLFVAASVVLGIGAHASSVSGATPRVVIVDNDGGFMPGESATGQWSFAPAHIEVVKGAMITFDNPANNFRPHTVTSFSLAGRFPDVTPEYGAKFNSSPAPDALIQRGQSFVLDTSTLDPGHYAYFCALHVWMVGSITVTPAPAP